MWRESQSRILMQCFLTTSKLLLPLPPIMRLVAGFNRILCSCYLILRNFCECTLQCIVTSSGDFIHLSAHFINAIFKLYFYCTTIDDVFTGETFSVMDLTYTVSVHILYEYLHFVVVLIFSVETSGKYKESDRWCWKP